MCLQPELMVSSGPRRRSRMEAFKALNEAAAEAEAAARRCGELRERGDQAGEEITQLSAALEAAAAKRAHLQCALHFITAASCPLEPSAC